jgi:hypothetical protein
MLLLNPFVRCEIATKEFENILHIVDISKYHAEILEETDPLQQLTTESSMEQLPNELIHEVFLFLPINSWFNALQVSKRFNSIGKVAFDPSINQNLAIQEACKQGRLNVVKQLLTDHRVDPTANHSASIRYAAEYGHVAIVKELLFDKRVDPGAINNSCIRVASVNGNY